MEKKIDFEELKKGGVVKLKEKDMFSIWVRAICCNMDAKKLKRVADIAEEYARGYILFSTRQIPIIPHIHFDNIERVRRELKEVYLMLDRCGARVRNADVCYDKNICREAVTNPISLGEKFDKFWHDDIPHKIKISIVGCKKQCTSPRVLSDIGFVGVADGIYDVYVGGRLGVKPFVGIKMAERLKEEECVKFVNNYFELLRREGRKGERSADLIQRLGENVVRKELNKNLEESVDYIPLECDTKLKEEEYDKIILRIKATCGEVTSDGVRKIADISEKYGKGFVHFAVRGAPEIPCIDKKYLPDIIKELEEENLELLNNNIDNLQTCFGGYCDNGIVDTQSLLRKIDKVCKSEFSNEYDSSLPVIKISASGCPNSCGISYINDIGFLGIVEPEVDIDKCTGCGICEKICKKSAIKIEDEIAVIDKSKCSYCGECIRGCPVDAKYEKRKGFSVLVGGYDGENTRLAQVIAEFVSEGEAVAITERCLKLIKEKKTNLYTIIEDIGIDKFKVLIL